MEKIIVTGASGLIGRQAVQILQNYNFDIHAITSKDIDEDSNKDISWHLVDLLDYGKVADFCRQVNANTLLHLAWYNDPKDRMTSLANIAWVEASLHLIRRFTENGGQRIVLAGSCAEYDWQYGYCNEELTPTDPETIYGVCKSSLNKIVEKYSKVKGIHYSCGRIFSVYGPYESEERLISYVIKSLLTGTQASLTNPDKIRDYLYVIDVADALVKLLRSDVSGAVNIGSGKPITLREIVDLIGIKLDKAELIKYGSGDHIRYKDPVVFADISKLRDELGWNPKYDLEKGIDATIAWWEKQLKIKAN